MLRAAAILAFIACANAATLTKKDGYGGSGYTQQSAAYPSSGGSSYDASASYSTADTAYGGAAAPAPSYGSGTSDSASSSGSGDSYGNLYYYYYPVTNHSAPAPSSYGSGGGSYGHGSGGSNNYGSGGGSYGGSSGGQSYGSSSSGGGSYGSGGGSYGGGSYQSGGGAVGGYYPPGGNPYVSDPFGGLLSLIGTIDINSLILPALLIGGVALLLPAILNCDLELGTCVIPLPTIPTGRRRRGLDMLSEQQMTIPQMIEHAYRIYDAVHEGEECMQRVVCEVGGMLSNIRGKEAFFSVLEHLSSPTYKKQLSVLKKGALGLSTDQESTCDAFQCGKLGLKLDHPIDNKVD